MAEGGLESEGYLTYMAEDSGNVAADGNFSVQVRLCHVIVNYFMSYVRVIINPVTAEAMLLKLSCNLQLLCCCCSRCRHYL